MVERNIRLLAVDDSIYMQMAIRTIAAFTPGIEIVGEAETGEAAVAMAARLKPDVITMGLQMPGMDGVEATRRIMATSPAAVIILSSLSERGMANAFRALEAGAVDFVSKAVGQLDGDLAAIARSIAQRILFWGRRGWGPPEAPAVPALPPSLDLLAIQASEGGPTLIREQLAALPATLRLPVLAVQRMEPQRLEPMLRYLQAVLPQRVQAAADGLVLEPGTVTLCADPQPGRVLRGEDGALRVDLSGGSDLLTAAMRAARAPLLLLLPGCESRAAAMLRAAQPGSGGEIWTEGAAGSATPADERLRTLPAGAMSGALLKGLKECRTTH